MRFIHKLHHFFPLNRIFFPANEQATLKTKQQIRCEGLFKVTDQIAEKWKTKSIISGKFCNFCWQFANSYFFYPKNWMNLISEQFGTASIKYLNWPGPVFGRFQNGCNKVVIEPHVQCAILVWDHTCDFKLNSRCALIRFWDHAYDFSPNCTPLCSITMELGQENFLTSVPQWWEW